MQNRPHPAKTRPTLQSYQIEPFLSSSHDFFSPENRLNDRPTKENLEQFDY